MLSSFINDLTQQRGLSECEVLFLSTTPLADDIAVVQEAVSTHENFRHLFFDVDPGLYGMWNRGWEVSRGTYISNLNLDDRLAHGALMAKVRFLQQNPVCDVLSTGVVTSTSPTQSFAEAYQKARDAKRTGQRSDNNVWFLLAEKGSQFLSPADFFTFSTPPRGVPLNTSHITGTQNYPHNSPVWRRELLRLPRGGFDLSVDPVSDYELWLRAICSKKVLCHLNRVTHTYFVDVHSHNRRDVETPEGRQKRVDTLNGVIDRHRSCVSEDLKARSGGRAAGDGKPTLTFRAARSQKDKDWDVDRIG